MKILSKHKHEEQRALSTCDDKARVLSVPKPNELDTVNVRVVAVQCCVTYPSVPVMIKELRESMPDHVVRTSAMTLTS